MGMGEPPADAFSTLIIIIIAVGLGTPLAIIIVGGVFVWVRKRMTHGSIYEPINWELMVQALPQCTHTVMRSLTPDRTMRTITRIVWMCLNICTDKLSLDENIMTSFWFKHVTYWIFYIFILQTDWPQNKSSDYLILFILFLDMMLVCSVSHNNNNNNNPACIISYFKNINFSLTLKYMQMFWGIKALMEVLRDSDCSRFSVSCSSDDFRRTLLLCCKLHFCKPWFAPRHLSVFATASDL